ncbi:MAG TPA: LamG-like jellyroll fold domain-containing protein, partial [Candidatus Paceibacterota bacterium]|nr:LamG-like jellyroll fold domain-containing protein [Candidatus Paceibacterota bacterium]
MTNQPLRLGKSVDTYWQALAGSLDDVRVYNRVLSATEVRQLYQLGGDKVASAATLQNGTTLGSGLVGYWSFNGADVTDKVYDRAGTNHGYLYNAATSSAKVQGKLGQGLNFDGAAAYVDLGDVQDQAGSFSLAAWVKRTGNSNGQAGTIIGKEMSSNHQFFLEVQDSDASNANKIRFAIWDVDTTQYSATTLQNNKWYHIVATYDDTTKAKTIYINGVSDSVVTGSGSPVANSDTLKIGYSQGTSNANNYFNGSIDEVRLYNRALSAGEVLQLYQLGK